MLRFFKILFFLVVIVCGLELHLRNSQLVTFNYYLGSIELPVSLLLALSLLGGAMLGILASLKIIISLRRKLHETRKALKQIESQGIDPSPLPLKNAS
jgi:putative membrane protein